MAKPGIANGDARPPKQKRRLPTVTARPFTAEEWENLEKILQRRCKQTKRSPHGIVRQIEAMLITYSKKPAPLVTVEQVRAELNTLLAVVKSPQVTSSMISDALVRAEFTDYLNLFAWPENVENDIAHLSGEVEKYLEWLPTKRGAPLHLSHPASGLVHPLQMILISREIPAKANRGTSFEKILRIVFQAAGFGHIRDPLSYARRSAIAL